jgi:hypothetical protein
MARGFALILRPVVFMMLAIQTPCTGIDRELQFGALGGGIKSPYRNNTATITGYLVMLAKAFAPVPAVDD